MGELHPLLESGFEATFGFRGSVPDGVNWYVTLQPSGQWFGFTMVDGAPGAVTDAMPSATLAAEALCKLSPAIRDFLRAHTTVDCRPRLSPSQEAGRVFRGKTYGRPTDDADDLTNDWTTIVAAKDSEIEELAGAVSDREHTIERAIEVLTGERHTYGDQSADMLVAEAGRALDRATKAEAKARQAALDSSSAREADRLRTVLRAIADISGADGATVPDHELASRAMGAAMLLAHRTSCLQREVDRLRASSPAHATADCPF